MDTTTTLNGSKQDSNNGNKQGNKSKKQRYLPGLPIASSAKDTNKGILYVQVCKSPIEFSALENYELFSTVDDGSDPMIKISVSKAARLSDAKPFQTGGGRCYRVKFANYQTQSQQNQNQSDI